MSLEVGSTAELVEVNPEQGRWRGATVTIVRVINRDTYEVRIPGRAAPLWARESQLRPSAVSWEGWTGARDYDGIPLAATTGDRAWLEEHETPEERRRRLSREFDLLVG